MTPNSKDNLPMPLRGINDKPRPLVIVEWNEAKQLYSIQQSGSRLRIFRPTTTEAIASIEAQYGTDCVIEFRSKKP